MNCKDNTKCLETIVKGLKMFMKEQFANEVFSANEIMLSNEIFWANGVK